MDQKTLNEKFKKMHELTDRKRTLKKESTRVEDQMKHLNRDLVDHFKDNNIQNMRVEGLGLFFLESKCYPNIQDKEAAFKWLQEKGVLEMMMVFNTNKFKSYYVEQLDEGRELPPGVKQFIDNKVKMRRG